MHQVLRYLKPVITRDTAGSASGVTVNTTRSGYAHLFFEPLALIVLMTGFALHLIIRHEWQLFLSPWFVGLTLLSLVIHLSERAWVAYQANRLPMRSSSNRPMLLPLSGTQFMLILVSTACLLASMPLLIKLNSLLNLSLGYDDMPLVFGIIHLLMSLLLFKLWSIIIADRSRLLKQVLHRPREYYLERLGLSESQRR